MGSQLGKPGSPPAKSFLTLCASLLDLARDFDDDDEAGVEESAQVEEHVDERPGLKRSDTTVTEVEEDISEDDGLQVPLTFQERSLREYFREMQVDENGLRTPPSKAHLTIFEMCVSIVCDYGQQDEKSHEIEWRLKGYATSYWIDHLLDIDLDNSADEDFVRIAKCIMKLMVNENNNVAYSHERHSVETYTEIFKSRDNETWLTEKGGWPSALVKRVVEHTAALSDENHEKEVLSWCRETVTDPSKMMANLARGHTENWYVLTEGQWILEAYKFGRDAFLLVCHQQCLV